MDDKVKTLRAMVRGVYDLQHMRIINGNRLAANFRSKLGLKPSEKEESDEESAKVLKQLRERYKKITDGIANEGIPSMKKFKGDEIISSYQELVLLENYFSLEAREQRSFRQIEQILVDFPIYNEFLVKVRGCGPAMSAVIISEIDIHKAKYVSSIWKYAGLAVKPVFAEDGITIIGGKAQSMKKEHLVEVEYTDKNGEIKTKLSIDFNPFLKAKMMGVLAVIFIKISNPKYSKIYRDYKSRLENHIDHKKKSKGHRDNMAKRYMVKRFIADLYAAWRPLEGLDAHPEYHIAKLGMLPHGQDSTISEN